MTLFDTAKRTLEGSADYTTDTFYYFSNSIRPEIINICNLLEEWYNRFPKDEKADLKGRFKATFYPAFYELYIHELFTKLGYHLEAHPIVAGTTKRPDYKATNDDGLFFFIEVKVVTLKSDQEKALERRTNVLMEAINQINANNFLLKLEEIKFKSASQPSGKLIVQHFDKLISKIDPDDYEKQLAVKGYENMSLLNYDDEKVTIGLQLFPKAPQFRGQKSKSIGTHPAVMQLGNDSDSLIAGLEKKSSRYGEFNAPYIICINKQTVAFDKIELQEALYGKLAFTYSTNPDCRDERMEYQENGFFGSIKKPKHTRVSAVYLTNANEANMVTTAGHALRHNPGALFPNDLVITKTIAEIFGLDKNYPFETLNKS